MWSPPCTPMSMSTNGAVRSPLLTAHLVNLALWLTARSTSIFGQSFSDIGYQFSDQRRLNGGVPSFLFLILRSIALTYFHAISVRDGPVRRGCDHQPTVAPICQDEVGMRNMIWVAVMAGPRSANPRKNAIRQRHAVLP